MAACRVFRGRVLAVAERMSHLSPHDRVKLLQELRSPLSELAEG